MKTLLLTTLLALTGAAQAHITLEQAETEAGKPFKAVLRVGHGCEGGAATKEIVITLPAALRNAKPMPKPGWTLSLPAPGQVRWVANSEADYLQDAWYDEFIVRGTPAEAGTLWLQVRQVCTSGEWNWAEIPASSSDRPRAPALKLVVKPANTPATGHVH